MSFTKTTHTQTQTHALGTAMTTCYYSWCPWTFFILPTSLDPVILSSKTKKKRAKEVKLKRERKVRRDMQKEEEEEEEKKRVLIFFWHHYYFIFGGIPRPILCFAFCFLSLILCL